MDLKGNKGLSGLLDRMDERAARRGGAVLTAWQFAKFSVVSMIAFLVQFAVLNTLQLIGPVRALYEVDLNWWIFHYPAAANGLGYFIAFNTANVTAQIVAFFVNRKKTFRADNSLAWTLAVYLIATVLLICFSTWLSPKINALLLGTGVGGVLAGNLSTILCNTIQFVLYFPIDKLLMRRKKSRAGEGADGGEQ